MYLGLDSGSTSIKGVIIDDAGKIIKSYYTRNIGLITTIKDVLKNLKIKEKIKGVGVTGSGRKFISALIGGDLEETEIIVHYLATITLYPEVHTIIDVGGEDCKLLIVNNKVLTQFEMNHVCGGGTGAMIESIGNRMGIKIEDVGDIALKSKVRAIVQSKCGIFAQSDVVSKLNKGVPKEDILMGVHRGMVSNYFTMLTKGKTLKPPYVFQGATAKNKALVKCFEEELDSEIIIPEQPELMGALGTALMVKEEMKGETKFKGFDNVNNNFSTKTYYAKGCSNECEITQIYENDTKIIANVGNRCEKCLKN